MRILRPYASVEPISFPLWDITGGDFNTTESLAAGDLMVNVDGAGWVNVTTLPSNVSGQVQWTPDAAEMTGKSIRLRLRDQTTPATFTAQMLIIETYGHASALHPNLGIAGGGSAPTAAAIRAEIDANSTQLSAIRAKTDGLPSDPADASVIAGSFASVSATLATIAGYLDTEVAAILSAVDTEVAAIKAKTDQLTFTAANQVDASVQSVIDAARRTIAVEVLLTNAAARGHRILIDGTDLVVTDTNGVTELSRQPFTRLPTPANPMASVG